MILVKVLVNIMKISNNQYLNKVVIRSKREGGVLSVISFNIDGSLFIRPGKEYLSRTFLDRKPSII